MCLGIRIVEESLFRNFPISNYNETTSCKVCELVSMARRIEEKLHIGKRRQYETCQTTLDIALWRVS